MSQATIKVESYYPNGERLNSRVEKILGLSIIEHFGSVACAENAHRQWLNDKRPKDAWDMAVNRARCIAYKEFLPSERKSLVEKIRFERA